MFAASMQHTMHAIHVPGCAALRLPKCRAQLSRPLNTSAQLHAAALGRRTRTASTLAAAAPSDCFVLDFDGVLVDSEPEVSMAGFRAAKVYFPEHVSEDNRQQVLSGLAEARPVLVSGWETVVQARLIAEDSGAASKILADWPNLLPATLDSWNLDLNDMRAVFDAERDRWMDEQEAQWLSLVKPYPNVIAALRYTEFPFYIASSKAPHRVSRVAEKQLGLDLPSDSPRLFAGLIPPNERKAEALRTIMQRPLVAEGGAKLHFIDDRLETVKAIAADAGLREGPGRLQVYFAEWGYSTPEEREAARTLEGVRSITLKQGLELIKWGILMGVDDGCGDDN